MALEISMRDEYLPMGTWSRAKRKVGVGGGHRKASEVKQTEDVKEVV